MFFLAWACAFVLECLPETETGADPAPWALVGGPHRTLLVPVQNSATDLDGARTKPRQTYPRQDKS